MRIGSLNIRFSIFWYDFWVGWYYDRVAKVLYVCPLPMLVFKFWRGE